MTENLKVLPTPKGWWKNGENCFVEEKICGDFEGARAAFCEDAKRCGFDFSDGEGGNMTAGCFLKALPSATSPTAHTADCLWTAHAVCIPQLSWKNMWICAGFTR